jgi:hypothetical protein
MGHRLEHFVCKLELGSNVDISTLVFCRVAVLGGGKDGDTAAIMLDLITAHAHLVGPDDSLKSVVLTESLGHIRTKLKTDTTLARAAAGVGLGVCPEHLHHETCLAGLPLVVTVELANIIQLNLVIREKTAVEDKVLVTNQGGQWEGREGLGEDLEDPLVIFSLTLAFESINLIHIIRLVVSTVQEETVGPQPLVSVKQQRNFARPGTTVDEITVEEISVCIGGGTVSSEDLE